MLSKIIDTYGPFHDAVILNVGYALGKPKTLEVTISCMNKQEGYKYEVIKLFFIEVITFRFVEEKNESNQVVNTALIKSENGIITFDFFPLWLESGIGEDVNSDFKVTCKDIRYARAF